jgi:hypothetical protein
MYKLGGRELTKIPVTDLLKWEATLEVRVRNERRRKSGRAAQGAHITFGGCS